MSFTPRGFRLLRIATIAIVAVLLVLFLRNLDWDKLAHALRHASLVPLLLSSVIYFVCLFGKALSWRIMLQPRNVVSIWRLYRYTIAAFAASALTPARAGELLRIWALKARDNVPVFDSTGVAIAEKLLDAVTLLLVCAPAPFLMPQLPGWVTNAMLACGGIAVAVLLVLFFAVGRIEAREPRSWFGRMIAGMNVVRDPKRMAQAILVLVLTWCADLIAVVLVLHAVGIDVPIGAAMFILFTFNLAVAIPAAPGQVGTLQVGALAATSVLGIPEEPALAFALLYQAMQLAPLLILAFVLELDLMRGRTRPEPQPAS
ncbi:MAG TPA: lysylphosphatidylglycerol synthase transmembrane domain-containing protein [Kofleriaceae bacterium]|nr:lysylphosphatidylglycerol synthase transmembrane domain-containing protein [Kofleriaceae bacterium]